MTNHTHLLLTPNKRHSLPELMQAIGRQYVQPINKRYSRTGTLWQARYKASLIQSDRYLLSCYRYIELNPVRAGMVKHPADYPYSSFLRNAQGDDDDIIVPHAIYEELGKTEEERRATYRDLFINVITADLLTEIRTATNACQVLGNERFKDQIEAMLGRSIRPGKAGRPRKRPIQK